MVEFGNLPRHWSHPSHRPQAGLGASLISRSRIFLLTGLAMIAFAGNSLLCRQALKHTNIDAASFTCIRIISGALALWLIVRLRDGTNCTKGNWPSAFALFA